MKRRFGIRTLCSAALAVTAFSLSSSLLAADAVKMQVHGAKASHAVHDVCAPEGLLLKEELLVSVQFIFFL